MSTYLPTLKQLQYLVALHEHGQMVASFDVEFGENVVQNQDGIVAIGPKKFMGSQAKCQS